MAVRRTLLRSLLVAPLVLFALVTISFFLMRLAPGGPFDGERRMDPEVRAALDASYGLDRPLIQQYGKYLVNLSRGDLGPSFQHRGRRVSEILMQGLPVSMVIGGAALLIAMILGVTSGAVAALWRNRWPDHASMLVALVGLSLPAFVIGPLLQMLFAMQLGWLPAAGWGINPVYAILPILTLALPFTARIARLTRAGLLEVLHQDWMRTARAKGHSWSSAVIHHGLRAGLTPVVAYVGPAAATIMTGSLVVEKIFQIPGLGRCFVDSAINRDYTVVLGAVIVYGVLIVVCNMLCDILHALMDPRV